MNAAALPSIAGRLGRALLASALVWSVAVSAAVWLAVQHELDELLDDTLRAAADGLLPILAAPPATPATAPRPPPSATAVTDLQSRYVWQLVAHNGGSTAVVERASAGAPSRSLQPTPAAGLGNVPGWRVYGHALGEGGRMLYVAQSDAERTEASLEVAFSAALSALAVSLLLQLWLRARTQAELQPLQRLAERLSHRRDAGPEARIGAAERSELQPVHEAIDALTAQLWRHVAQERTFSAHAAHALRTPLAGIDAQLALALREAPDALRPRLERARAAAHRLQRVVGALLALFRSDGELQRQAVDAGALLARLPADGLALDVRAPAPVDADADLLTAALANLLDNALRHGAHRVTLSQPDARTLRIADDGPGVQPARREDLQRALDAEAYDGATGLGLMLADRVARAHGGAVRLPPPRAGEGFVVELRLGAARDAATSAAAPAPASP